MNIVIIGGSRGIGKAAAEIRRLWKRPEKNWPERQRIPVMPGRQRKPPDWWKR